jgi:branched-chain amino acid transport system permease protein
VAIVAVGGMANLWGAIAASVVLSFLSLRGYFGSYDEAVFGTILVAVMLFAPNGILVKPGQIKELGKRVKGLMKPRFEREEGNSPQSRGKHREE